MFLLSIDVSVISHSSITPHNPRSTGPLALHVNLYFVSHNPLHSHCYALPRRETLKHKMFPRCRTYYTLSRRETLKHKTVRPHQHVPFYSNLSKHVMSETSRSTINSYSRHCHCPYSHLSLFISLVPAVMRCLPVLVIRLHISRIVASVSAVGKQLHHVAADHLLLASIALLTLVFS